MRLAVTIIASSPMGKLVRENLILWYELWSRSLGGVIFFSGGYILTNYNLIDGIWRGVWCYSEDLPAHV